MWLDLGEEDIWVGSCMKSTALGRDWSLAKRIASAAKALCGEGLHLTSD